MSVDTPAPASGRDGPARAARRLLRTARKGALATLDHRYPGHPYASLVLTATETSGAPVTMISGLALHTRNLAQDARASLLLEDTGTADDPLSAGRLTLRGHLRPSTASTARRRFLARHPSAQGYAALPDFQTFTFEIAGGHFIGGFARIVDLGAAELTTDIADAAELIAAEAGILDHMNADHAEAVALYATEIAKCPPGDWRMSGIDPEGADLLHRNNSARIEFAAPVKTPDQARSALVALVRQARSRR
jgi:putative heme iron utilization protein